MPLRTRRGAAPDARTTALAATAASYASAMTSIRGRRVQRLVLREFAGFDEVVHALTPEGRAALLGLSANGDAALLASDGRGKTIEVIAGSAASGTLVRRRFDLLKDSLPLLGEERLGTADRAALARLSLVDASDGQQALYARFAASA